VVVADGGDAMEKGGALHAIDLAKGRRVDHPLDADTSMFHAVDSVSVYDQHHRPGDAVVVARRGAMGTELRVLRVPTFETLATVAFDAREWLAAADWLDE
jgi:hypothetical protein